MVRPKRNPPNFSSVLWPVEPCSDPDAEFMRQVAINLKDAIAGRSLRHVARETGVDHTLVAKILSGSAWVEAITIVRIERGLNVSLWPRRS